MTRWCMLAPYLVRLAGFAFDRLAPLRCAQAAGAAEALAEATSARITAGRALDAALGAERYAANPAFDDPAARKELSRRVKQLRAFARDPGDAPLPKDALRAVIDAIPAIAAHGDALAAAQVRWLEARAAYGATFAADFARAREVLRRMYADDERLVEAVFLESPEALARIQQLIAGPAVRNARVRQRERLAALYAQRFCAKNETNSFCGPHGLGFADAGAAGAPSIELVTEDARRVTYVSHWAAQELLDAVLQRAGDTAPLAFRLRSSAQVRDGTVAWCTMEHDATTTFRRRWGRTALPPAVAQLVTELASPRTLRELVARAGALGLELDADDIAELVDQLVGAGIVVRAPRVPTGVFEPLRWVAAELARWPASDARTWALAEIATMEGIVAAYAHAPLARRIELAGVLAARFVAATGATATRGEGQHYADRALLHEDSYVEVRASLGEARGVLERTLPTLIAALGLPLELARERVRGWFRARFGAGVRVPVLDVHRAFDEDRVLETPAAGPRAEALRGAIARVRDTIAHSAATAGSGPARIASEDLRAALAESTGSIEAGYVSVDVLVRRLATRCELVLGEVHGFIWLPTCLLDVLPPAARDRVVAEMQVALRAMAGGRRSAECVFLHTQATDRRIPIADTDLQMITPTGRSEAIDFGELELLLAGDTFAFWHGGGEVVPLVAYARYPFVLYTSRIAPLFDDFAERFFPDSLLPEALREADAPRLAVDDLVFRRRSWRRPAAEIMALLAARDEADLLARGQRLRSALGCPEQVFASLPGEPKPIFLDFANVFLLEALVNQLERQPADAKLKLSEMLPAADELVARAPDGLRTSELRIGFYTLTTSTTS